MTIGRSKGSLQKILSKAIELGQSAETIELLRALLEGCVDLDPWLPIESAPTDGKRVLLSNKLWDAPSTGCFDGCDWVIQPGIVRFKYPPTHYKLLQEDPK